MSEVELKPVHRIALGIEYDGSKYYGWQRQNEVRSVQEKLEKRSLRWRIIRSLSIARVVLTQACTVPVRWCILKPRRCVKMLHGRLA
ncbi:tRNA pseudouridine synthase A [Lelliottia amnigena]|nr:tRNA pseudouridine synthase A [Lelliottia amnigena]